MILLDTDVVSGLMRPSVDAALAKWLGTLGELRLAVSTVTVSEIVFGLARLPDGKRKAQLSEAVESFLGELEIVDFDRSMAVVSGAFRAQRASSGKPMSHADSMIGAAAAVMDADLATRNTRDFEGLAISIVNPWSP